MRNLIILFVIFVTFSLNAQTPFTMITATKKLTDYSERSISLSNPYLGWKVAYNVSGDIEDNDVIQYSARTMIVAATGDKWALPLLVDVAKPDSAEFNTTTSIGAFPYFSIAMSDRLQLLAHTGLDYSINGGENNDQFRTLAGLEAALYPLDNGLPYTLSTAVEYKWFTGDSDSGKLNLNITGVIPIVNAMGLLIQGALPLDGNERTAFEIGVIMNWQVK